VRGLCRRLGLDCTLHGSRVDCSTGGGGRAHPPHQGRGASGGCEGSRCHEAVQVEPNECPVTSPLNVSLEYDLLKDVPKGYWCISVREGASMPPVRVV
jgi:hypothetical protein